MGGRGSSAENRPSWARVLETLDNHDLLDRYRQRASNPKSLFEAIGEDLVDNRERIRKQAFWALVVAMPEVADTLHERESKQPGWRNNPANEQASVSQSVDLVSHLYNVLVRQHRFTSRQGSTDPRPYIGTALRRWQIDSHRRQAREVPLDSYSMDRVADTIDVAEEAANAVELPATDEMHAWGFLREDEIELFEALYVDERDIREIARQHGVTAAAIRKRVSRIRGRASRLRDAILAHGLIFSTNGWAGHNVTIGGEILFPYMRIDAEPILPLIGWSTRARDSLSFDNLVALFSASENSENENDLLGLQFSMTRELGGSKSRIHLIICPQHVCEQFGEDLESLLLSGYRSVVGAPKRSVTGLCRGRDRNLGLPVLEGLTAHLERAGYALYIATYMEKRDFIETLVAIENEQPAEKIPSSEDAKSFLASLPDGVKIEFPTY